MALFDKENYGKPISVKLSRYLRAHTNKHDRADVSEKTGVGTSTIRDVIFRVNSLTENNSKAIIPLMRIAIKNCEKSISTSAEIKEGLQSMLNR